ncbi:spexin isoform X2 [Ambystoma mexicanum]|uniref:spexin isoform X2 n=1 Tax=Ambystoma mexicanum TaxID=8296 RepID=UPI0037E8A8E3
MATDLSRRAPCASMLNIVIARLCGWERGDRLGVWCLLYCCVSSSGGTARRAEECLSACLLLPPVLQVFPRLAACVAALLLTASFISHSRSAPQGRFQRRNWTPQAMLYLKGAQGRRFISDESQRKDLYDRLELETRSRHSNPISISEAAAMFLSSLRKAQEDAEEDNMDQPAFLPDTLLNW